MVYFFLILTMVSLILFIIGLINPSLVIVRLKKKILSHSYLWFNSPGISSAVDYNLSSPRPTLPSKMNYLLLTMIYLIKI